MQLVFSGTDNYRTCELIHGVETSDIPCLDVNIEEADIRIIPHAIHETENGASRIVVLSDDTDVIILVLHFWETLHQKGLKELWVKGGVGDSTRYIPIHLLAEKHQSICATLPALHALSGCDVTSKVGTQNAALKAQPAEYLADFGQIPNDQDTEPIYEKAEMYVVQVLKRGSNCKTTDELRHW